MTTELADGELEVTGRLLQASNATFLATLHSAGSDVQCVYKPMKGERPLWDFPEHTLALREVAAYEVSRLGGFDLVPVTVLVDGPVGVGSLQVWVEEDEEDPEPLVDIVSSAQVPRPGYFDVVEGLDARDRPVAVVHADHPRLRLMATFDALINNADRKGGHILASAGAVFGVDHGISFHTEPKLRTLLWGWAGKPLERQAIEAVGRVRADAASLLESLLSAQEIDALLWRADRLLGEGCLPQPGDDWPSIPWPPF
nr:SCO1664 family protein [Microlunatus panaciterrae]